jgi:hypothetical protein
MQQSERQEHHDEEPWQVPKRSGERVAFNDAIFRKANEEIRDRAEAVLEDGQDRLPVICECAEETCSEVLRVPLREYERVRSNPRLFFNAPGHDAAGGRWAQVVERHEDYVVIEKQGRAAEIVEMLDEDQ